ncbi:MAG: glycoside hydrolase family 2 TIM barrel-domain containing protein [Mobilitalea sp.]
MCKKKGIYIAIILFILLVGTSANVYGSLRQGSKGRVVTLFNDGWKFKKVANNSDINMKQIDTSNWEEVKLPHTWNAIDGCDGYAASVVEADGSIQSVDSNDNSYYRGVGGYLKEYTFASEIYQGKKVFIEFEGANTVTTLYINGKKVGKAHKGGYAAFRYDITGYIKLDQVNIIAVAVDNSRTTDIAPIDWEGDFTKFGGIYRDVSILAVDKIHIDLMDYGSDGIYVSTDNVSSKSADTNIKVNITNDDRQSHEITVRAEISSKSGKIVAKKEETLELKNGITAAVTMNLPITKPHLWKGINDPYLYDLKITLLADNYIDEKIIKFGYRSFQLSNTKGLLLNGKKYNVNGVNYHQDSYENGWAMTSEQYERDFSIMKEMGVTAVRFAHYQHNQYEYELCDNEQNVLLLHPFPS